MSTLIRDSRHIPGSLDRRPMLAGGLLAIVLAAFLLAPGDLGWKSHVALHGLCAQRPSHSLQIGGATLPMDARMTGIYIGAAVAVVWLAAAGRLRSTRMPSRAVLMVLAAFVVVLALDGFNALLVDLEGPHPYQPSNLLRLVTGILGGTTLGVVLGHLFAVSMWANGDGRRAVVTSLTELLAPIGISGSLASLALSGLPPLFAPFAVGLLIAAVGVFGFLGLVVVALLTDRGWSSRTFADLTPLAAAGFIAGIVTIGGLSGLRFLAEQVLGLPQLT